MSALATLEEHVEQTGDPLARCVLEAVWAMRAELAEAPDQDIPALVERHGGDVRAVLSLPGGAQLTYHDLLAG